MAKKDYYRKVYEDFKKLCSQGQQPGSFSSYCREKGLSSRRVRTLLGHEYENLRGIKGYAWKKSATSEGQYLKLYEDFKTLCGNGQQPGSFGSYCEGQGFNAGSVCQFLKRKKLRLRDIAGYERPSRGKARCREIPFENIIFEGAGFLPADGGNVITVKVKGHVSVSFPASTDIETIAKFVKELGKEVSHVGS